MNTKILVVGGTPVIFDELHKRLPDIEVEHVETPMRGEMMALAMMAGLMNPPTGSTRSRYIKPHASMTRQQARQYVGFVLDDSERKALAESPEGRMDGEPAEEFITRVILRRAANQYVK